MALPRRPARITRHERAPRAAGGTPRRHTAIPASAAGIFADAAGAAMRKARGSIGTAPDRCGHGAMAAAIASSGRLRAEFAKFHAGATADGSAGFAPSAR
jgi:hypothetical protein